MSYRIQTLNEISPKGLARLPAERYEVGPKVQSPDALLVRSADLHKLAIPAGVRAIGRAGAGVNNIPVAQMSRRGIVVFNAPGANANAVKELVLAGLLLAARNIAPAWLFARSLSGDDAAIDAAVEKGKKHFVGFELPGRTLGVVGLGAIGVEVANSALALGMKVLGYDPQITVQRAWQLSSSVAQARSLEDLFARADAISVHVPLNASTHHMIGAAELATMKPSAIIVNTSRGPVIDEKAMTAALSAGKLFGAGLDVFDEEPTPPDNPLLKLDNVILGPHALCWTDQCFAGNGAADVRAVLDVQHGREPRVVVNRAVLETARWRERLAELRTRFAAE